MYVPLVPVEKASAITVAVKVLEEIVALGLVLDVGIVALVSPAVGLETGPMMSVDVLAFVGIVFTVSVVVAFVLDTTGEVAAVFVLNVAVVDVPVVV